MTEVSDRIFDAFSQHTRARISNAVNNNITLTVEDQAYVDLSVGPNLVNDPVQTVGEHVSALRSEIVAIDADFTDNSITTALRTKMNELRSANLSGLNLGELINDTYILLVLGVRLMRDGGFAADVALALAALSAIGINVDLDEIAQP